MIPTQMVLEPSIRKSLTVHASAAHAFQVFTGEFDKWWPRSHHIGSAPMKKAVIEGWVGGRCYNEQTDGADCDWGRILLWEPPYRFIMAWQINPAWQYEPDLAKCSEVEVRFTPASEDSTRVELEHRYFERHGPGSNEMCKSVDGPMGWGGLMELFKAQAEKSN